MSYGGKLQTPLDLSKSWKGQSFLLEGRCLKEWDFRSMQTCRVRGRVIVTLHARADLSATYDLSFISFIFCEGLAGCRFRACTESTFLLNKQAFLSAGLSVVPTRLSSCDIAHQ